MSKLKFLLGLALVSWVLPACRVSPDKAVSSPSSMAGGDSGAGNGGAGIVRNGDVLTFGQSGVKLDLLERVTDVPGLSYMNQLIDKISVAANVKGMLDKAIQPLGARRYYKINENDLSPRKRAELIARYEQFIHQKIPGDQLTLLAVTIGKETYFLPDFFKLSDDQAKAAIVFHEALWVINQNLTLATVIRAEVAIENLLRSPLFQQPMIYDRDLMQVLKDTFKDPYLGLVGAILFDFRAGPVRIAFPDREGPASKVFQDPIFSLKELIGENAVLQTSDGEELDTNLMHDHFVAMQRANPGMAIFSELMAESESARLDRISSTQSSFWINFRHIWNNDKYGDEALDLSRPYYESTFYADNQKNGEWELLKIRGMKGTGGSIGGLGQDGGFERLNYAVFLEFQAVYP